MTFTLHGKTVLITGGTGFIGQPLCQALTKLGGRVFVLTRQNRPAKDNIFYIPSLDHEDLPEVDIVINLAGEPIAQRWNAKTKEKIMQSRLKTTGDVIRYIERSVQKPEVLISGSAIGFYGTDKNEIFDENSAPSNGAPFSRTLCHVWETEAAQARSQGVRTVFLRTGAVLEKNGGMLAKLLLPFKLGLGGPIGSGKQWLSWIDRDDLINLILYIIQSGDIEGPVNGTAPHPVRNSEFAKCLSQMLSRPCLFPTPGIVLRAVFSDMADEIMLQGQHVIPRKAMDHGFVFAYPNLSSSLRKIFKDEKL